MRGKYFFIILLALQSTACTTPATRNDAFAIANGFSRQVIRGDSFSHLVFINKIGTKKTDGSINNSEWHVYIEGDGKPWIKRRTVASDPTSEKPVMLPLMAQDKNAAIYLGRPCYNGINDNPECTPWMWTYGRYSEQVVESMRAALATLVQKNEIDSLVLIGHSGGGTLAMLLAEQVPQVRIVVTLGGNLDIDAWAARHNYTKLVQSINPARRPPLPRRITQLHFVGAGDKNVPPEMLTAAIKQQHNANLFVLDDVTHKHGWNDRWTDILIKIDSQGDKP